MTPILFQGIAAASVAGLLLGGVMRPELGPGEAPEQAAFIPAPSPQADPAWIAPQPGPQPDYVIGTDWLRPTLEASPGDVVITPDTEVYAAAPEAPPRRYYSRGVLIITPDGSLPDA